ncbi:MAG: hypothetical protein Q8L88_02235 [Bacteroidota bacterium]|nr:hypothetical protein [Bacteroidota bacterium]
MNHDLTKVISESVQIFVAVRAAEGTVTTSPSLAVINAGGDATWIKVGAAQKKKTKLVGNPYTTEVDDGLESNNGVGVILTARSVERTTAQETALEGFENKILDVIMRVTDATKAYKFVRCSLVKQPDFPFNQEESQGNELRFKRDAAKFSDAITVITLA